APPVFLLPHHHSSYQPLPLPHRKLPLLHSQLLHSLQTLLCPFLSPCLSPCLSFLSPHIPPVQLRQLPQKDPQRPTVTHDVVHPHHHHLLSLSYSPHLHPQQRPPA